MSSPNNNNSISPPPACSDIRDFCKQRMAAMKEQRKTAHKKKSKKTNAKRKAAYNANEDQKEARNKKKRIKYKIATNCNVNFQSTEIDDRKLSFPRFERNIEEAVILSHLNAGLN